MLDSYQLEVARRLDAGAELDEVEAQFIDPAPELTDDERAALWLFAWSYRERPVLSSAAGLAVGGDGS